MWNYTHFIMANQKSLGGWKIEITFNKLIEMLYKEIISYLILYSSFQPDPESLQ